MVVCQAAKGHSFFIKKEKKKGGGITIDQAAGFL